MLQSFTNTYRRSMRPMLRGIGLIALGIMIGILIGLGVPTGAHAQEQTDNAVVVPSLIEAIYLALDRGSSVATARLELEETALGHHALAAGLLGWRIDAHVNDQLSDDMTTFSTFEADEPVHTLSATLSVRKALGVSARTKAALNEGELAVQFAANELQRTIADNIIETYDAYRHIELALLQRALADRATTIAQRGWEAARQRLAEGALAAIEAEEARLAHVEAQHRQRSVHHFVDVAWHRLAQLIGVSPQEYSADVLPVRSFESLGQHITDTTGPFYPERAVPWDSPIDVMTNEAKDRRTEIADARSFVALAEIDAEKTRLERRPTVHLNAQMTFEDHVTTTVAVDQDWALNVAATKAFMSHDPVPADPALLPFLPDYPWWEVSLGITFNLWDSGAGAQGDASKNRTLRRATQGLAAAEDGIELDVLHRHAQVLADFDGLDLAVSRVHLAYDQLQVEKEKQTLGIGIDLTVDRAFVDYLAAVIGAVEARFTYETAVLELARSRGFAPDDLLDLAEQLQRW